MIFFLEFEFLGFFWIFFGNSFFYFPCFSEIGFLISFPVFSSILQVVSLEILHFLLMWHADWTC